MNENNYNSLLNKLVEDNITKFRGIVTAVVYYVASSTELLVENKKETRWIDVDRIKLIEL